MPAKRILLVEDNRRIADLEEYPLKENGFAVVVAADGAEGLRCFRQFAPDLVLLDLILPPGMSGLDLFREMRRLRPEIPIVMVTDRAEEIDRVLGLELGADDYVTKPFSPRELVARVRAVLRRSARPAEATPTARVVHGPLALDTEAYTTTYFGTEVALTRAEFRLLAALARSPARVFTREVLIQRLYDGEQVVTDRSIDACVKRLRHKLQAVRRDVDPIATVHGIGYKLHQALEEAP
jgi:two-component system response regulator BaeR